jgi:ATP-dependent DNA helicase PIF1
MELKDNAIKAKILNGKNIGSEILLCRITFSTDHSDSISMTRHQFPIRLAYSMTINKCQGQTINKVGIYFESALFAHGQLYTAMSRVRNPNALRILFEKPNLFNKTSAYLINNIVYKEVLTEFES